jgi:hypothetical protein
MSFSDKLDWASMAFATLGIGFFVAWIIMERTKGKTTRETGLNLSVAAHILFQVFMMCALTLGLARGIHADDTAEIAVSGFGLGVFAATVLVMAVSRAKQRHNDVAEAKARALGQLAAEQIIVDAAKDQPKA